MIQITDVKTQFVKELEMYYPEREVRQMFRMCAEKFADIPYNQVLLKDVTISPEIQEQFLQTISQLKKYVPIQYIMGEEHFYGLVFQVDNSVLIPRPETEELVHWVLEEWKDKGKVRMVDLCSGSGCIPVAISKNSTMQCEGYEVSETAVATANRNAKLLNADVPFFVGDVFQQSKENLPMCDVLTANPPYVTEEDKNKVPENVWHEPHIALFAPPEDDLIYYRKIAEIAREVLLPGGACYVEINYDYSKEVAAIFEAAGFGKTVIKEDINGKPRMVKAYE